MERDGSQGPLHPRRDPDEKRALLSRLARIEGQVRGLRQMVEADRYTGEVIQQAAAIRAALREVAIMCFQGRALRGVADVAGQRDRRSATVDKLLAEMTGLLQAALNVPVTLPAPADRKADGSELDHADDAERLASVQKQIEALLDQEPTNVLLVEDDPVAAEVLRTGLDLMGCSVMVAASGEDALDVLKQKDCAVDWLLADIVLPGRVDGWTVGQEFRERNPFGRVVFISAYEQKDLSRKTPGSAFLYKPVRPAQLVKLFRGLESAA
jgi:DNA-binding FrmR family transcriptional regulator/CheY-like chemotaxis protein